MPPLVIAGAIAGGTALAGAGIGAHASNKAANQQQQSADRALNFQRDVFNQSSQALSPFIHMGQSAMGRYDERYGGAPMQPQTMVGPWQYVSSAVPLNATGPRPVGAGQTPQAAQGSGQMVQLRAPSGEVSAVPAHLAEQFIARGAQRVA